MRYRVHPLSLAISLVLSSSAFANTENSNNATTDSTTTVAVSSTNSTASTNNAVDDTLKVVVKAKRVSQTRNHISTETGGSSYQITAKEIANMPQGDSTPLNQVLLQAPGVAQDSFGQIHVRGDHGDLQYRINGTILPESISGFGQTLDPSFMQSVNVLTGALPAEYGDRTAGIVDIHTKTGVVGNSGSIGVTVGSNNSREVTGSLSGSKDDLTYYVNGSFLTNNLGIENPTSSNDPIHDHTNQFKGFGYFSDPC